MIETNKIDKNKVLVWIIVLLGIVIRILMAYTHFTHSDDNGAMNELMARKALGFEGKDIYWGFWTYAPLQVFLSALLVNCNYSYMTNLILGRLPSLVFGMLVLIVVKVLLERERAKENKKDIGEVLILVLCAFSWENIIYSAQAEPYEVVVFIGFLIYFFLQINPCESWTQSIIVLLVMSICCYAHFQVFMFAFAMYISLFFINLNNKKNIIKLIFMGSINVLSAIPLLIKMKDTGMLEKGVNWNVGIGGMFNFHLPSDGALKNILYIINFFGRNTFLIFRYYFTIEDLNILGISLTVLLIFLAMLGFFYVHKNRIVLAIYIDVLFALNFIMIVRGSLTYGPSRHMIFMFPTMIILILFGIIQMSKIWKRDEVQFRLIKVVSLACVLMFALAFPNEYAQRRNYLSEAQVRTLVEKYNPDFIYGFNWMTDLYGMKIEGYDNKSMAWGSAPGWFTKVDQKNNTGRFMIISRTITADSFWREDSENLELFKERLSQNNYSEIETSYPNYRLIYKKEVISNEEVEYASKYYDNYGNGLCLYIFESN